MQIHQHQLQLLLQSLPLSCVCVHSLGPSLPCASHARQSTSSNSTKFTDFLEMAVVIHFFFIINWSTLFLLVLVVEQMVMVFLFSHIILLL
uniref:Putative ovule protein n=1 Tax=Solanum chacoense TaxID=4108 RepID=A0A0V0H3Z6_SOLCH